EKKLAKRQAVGAIVLCVPRSTCHFGDQVRRRVIAAEQFVVRHREYGYFFSWSLSRTPRREDGVVVRRRRRLHRSPYHVLASRTRAASDAKQIAARNHRRGMLPVPARPGPIRANMDAKAGAPPRSGSH